jgi:hypothetical protein
MAVFRKAGFIIGMCAITMIPIILAAADNREISEQPAIEDSKNAAAMAGCLKNGRPTLAYFYYSVACSCTAVQCSLASAAIADTPELQEKNEEFNFVRIDAFYYEEADSLYDLFLIPAMIAYGKDGRELSRVEWDIDRESVRKLINLIRAYDGH